MCPVEKTKFIIAKTKESEHHNNHETKPKHKKGLEEQNSSEADRYPYI